MTAMFRITTMSRITTAFHVAAILVLSSLSACSDPPRCVPGRAERCPCLPKGEGIQLCAEDGSRFLPCQCSTPIPRLQSGFSQVGPLQKNRPLALKSSSTAPRAQGLSQDFQATHEKSDEGLSTSRAASTAHAMPTQSRETLAKKTRDQVQVVALEALVEDATPITPTNNNRPSMGKMFRLKLRNQQKDWWFYSSAFGKCIRTEQSKGEAQTPLKLISEGCYRRLDNGNEMIVRCDDRPLGPKTYHFAKNIDLCQSYQHKKTDSAQRADDAQHKTSAKIAALEPVIEGAVRGTKRSSRVQGRSRPQQASSQSRAWYCACYQERVQGVPTHATACRPNREMCLDLTSKVKRGSSILVPNSVSVPCQKRRGSSPWKTFRKRGSKRALWKASTHPGAWWSPGGCFLPGGPKSPRPSGAHAPSKKKNISRVSKQREPVEQIPPELMRSIGTKRSLIRFGERGSAPRTERCAEACRANLISRSMRQREYGMPHIPPLLRWGGHYAERVKFIKATCLKTQPKSRRNKSVCLDQVIQKCTRYCERSG